MEKTNHDRFRILRVRAWTFEHKMLYQLMDCVVNSVMIATNLTNILTLVVSYLFTFWYLISDFHDIMPSQYGGVGATHLGNY